MVVNYTLVEEDILAGKTQGQGKLYPNVKVDMVIVNWILFPNIMSFLVTDSAQTEYCSTFHCPIVYVQT